MKPTEPRHLVFSPYKTPPVKIGDLVTCEINGICEVKDFTNAPIPQPVKAGQGAAVIVCGDLPRAIRDESASAVAYWWGVSTNTVRGWRRALGVDRINIGTRERLREIGRPDIAHYATEANRISMLPESRARRDESHRQTLLARYTPEERRDQMTTLTEKRWVVGCSQEERQRLALRLYVGRWGNQEKAALISSVIRSKKISRWERIREERRTKKLLAPFLRQQSTKLLLSWGWEFDTQLALDMSGKARFPASARSNEWRGYAYWRHKGDRVLWRASASGEWMTTQDALAIGRLRRGLNRLQDPEHEYQISPEVHYHEGDW